MTDVSVTLRLDTMLYKFGNTLLRINFSSPNKARMKNRTDLNLGDSVYKSIICYMPDSLFIEWLRF